MPHWLQFGKGIERSFRTIFRSNMVSRKMKFLIPKDRGELVPMFFVMFLISVFVIFELSVILPTIYHNIFTYKEILHLIFGVYIIFNLLGNLYLSLLTDTSIDTIICPVLLPTSSEPDAVSQHCNWHYCRQCEANVPPRSEHCHLCKKCILKRDHHCTFFGRCIGFRNIRYYLCFLIWSWVSDQNRTEYVFSKLFAFRSDCCTAISFIWTTHTN